MTLTLLPDPPSRPRKRRGWSVPPEDEKIIRRVLEALSDAREAAGWVPMRLRPSSKLRRDAHGGLVRRLHELREDGEADPEMVLIAVMRAKVEQHRRRNDEFGDGVHAIASAICAKDWWPKNLAAGMALIAGAKATRRSVGGGYVPHSKEYDLR